VSAEPFYLETAGGTVAAYLHRAEDPRRAAVLLCPIGGWEDVASYRPRYDWAEHLAAAGYTTLRFEPPGFGDSAGGPADGALVERWAQAVDDAARWLAAEARAPVTAIGIGLGGVVVTAAVERGAPLDGLVLWGVASRGRTALRELRAFARIESSTIVAAGAPEPPPLPEGVLAPGGLLVSAETSAAFQALEPTDLRGPTRALLLERDGLPVDPELRTRLVDAGVDVRVAAGSGYAAMVAAPADARRPLAVFPVVDEWLAEAPPREAPAARAAAASDTLVLGPVRERWLSVPTDEGTLVGVLAEPVTAPVAGVTAVLLNAGVLRRTGPNRFWTETARRWAAAGVPTLRLDFAGVGDSEGRSEQFADYRSLYTDTWPRQVAATLAELERAGLPPRFVVGGLCSGAHWAFQTALTDPRVVQAVVVNGSFFYFDESVAGARTWSAIRRRFFEREAWRRLLQGQLEVPVRGLLRSLARRPARTEERLPAALDSLAAHGRLLDVVSCDGEPLVEELLRFAPLDRWPNVTVERVPGRDHLFRPLWMHPHVVAALDRVLERALGSTRAPADRATVPAPVGDGDRQHDA
jgi:alpha-beta hydrolase superfamily lysophospholipase